MASQKPPSSPDDGGERSDKSKGGEGPLIYDSDDLFQGRRDVWIKHGDEMYRLRITSAGNLYLTK